MTWGRIRPIGLGYFPSARRSSDSIGSNHFTPKTDLFLSVLLSYLVPFGYLLPLIVELILHVLCCVYELLVVLWLELLRREDQLVIAQILVLKRLPLFEFLKLLELLRLLKLLQILKPLKLLTLLKPASQLSLNLYIYV